MRCWAAGGDPGPAGVMPAKGGLPLVANNHTIGATGVSCGTAQEDGIVAAAAASR